jgi:hypothetical protein
MFPSSSLPPGHGPESSIYFSKANRLQPVVGDGLPEGCLSHKWPNSVPQPPTSPSSPQQFQLVSFRENMTFVIDGTHQPTVWLTASPLFPGPWSRLCPLPTLPPTPPALSFLCGLGGGTFCITMSCPGLPKDALLLLAPNENVTVFNPPRS